jgi:exonuclease III
MPNYKSIKDYEDKAGKARMVDKLLLLRADLDTEIPKKTDSRTLLLATWNIREFNSKNRIDESFHYIAEIVSRFDLIAVQEVSPDLKALERLMSLLDDNWDYLVTDSTEGDAGGGERMAFVYDRNKIKFRKLAGEIVLPPESLKDGVLQFARTPFVVAFQAGWFRFILTTVHIFFGNVRGEKLKQRIQEIQTITKFLAKRAKKEDENYILLGDFNITDPDSEMMKALVDNKFFVPEALRSKPSDIGKTNHYDQIAFNVKEDDNMLIFDKTNQKAGAYNYFQIVYRDDELATYKPFFTEKNVAGKTDQQLSTYYRSKWRTFQMSDHLPLWVELRVDFSDEYLRNMRKEIV